MASALAFVVSASPVLADSRDDPVEGGAETVEEAVRVTIVVSGGQHVVRSVSGTSGSATEGCSWSVVFAPDLDDTPYGTSAGPMPDPDARFALLLCDGQVVRPIWVAPADVVDLDALARAEAQRYIEDVLAPTIQIGVNPAARGLVGLPSWFWVEGFTGSVAAPPITAFGLTIDVRMSSGGVTWSFGDGTTVVGDLGRAYPAESTVTHIHQTDGRFTVSAAIHLAPEYRVDGGPWLLLPDLQASATSIHQVDAREAVITRA